MSARSEFYLSSNASIKPLELLEISHPNFTKTYYIVRNSRYGVTVTLEDGVTTQFFEYRPLLIKGLGVNQTLDQIIEIQFGDLGSIIPLEIDAVRAADGFRIKPALKFRAYRSDDLSAPMYGPIVYEVPNFPFNSQGSSFQANAPQLNNNKTGEIYAFGRFPMLRGFL